jgi:hypothetical protein
MAHEKIKLKDIEQTNCVSYERKDRKKLRKTFLKEGYNIKKGIIVIGIDNKIFNGNHRYCLLLKKYGEEHEIVVNREPYTYMEFYRHPPKMMAVDEKSSLTYFIYNIVITMSSTLFSTILFLYSKIKDYHNKGNKKI